MAFPDKDHDNGGGRHKGRDDHDHDEDRGRDRSAPPSARFQDADHQWVRRYYQVPSDLPPGLRKKYYRTGTLPPGWEKRFQPFPPVLVQRLPPLPPQCDRGYVDGYAVIYDRKTRVIMDTIDLIGAITGR